MTLSPELDREYCRIVVGVMRRIDERAEVAKIETSVMVMDLSAWVNRSLGQIQRRARERIRERQVWPAQVERECAAIRKIIAETA